MISFLASAIVIVLWQCTFACDQYHEPECIVTDPLNQSHFLNKWIVHIEGGNSVAKEVAREVGLRYMEPMDKHVDHYFFTHPDVPERHMMKHADILQKLQAHKKILSSDQQFAHQLTLNELDDFKDMVGYSEPLEVIVSTFDPNDEEALLKYEQRSLDVPFEELSEEEKKFREKYASEKLLPLHQIIDFPALYVRKKETNKEYWQKVKEAVNVNPVQNAGEATKNR